MVQGTYTPFLRRFTDERALDLASTIALYDRVGARHRASKWSDRYAQLDLTNAIIEAVGKHVSLPTGPVRDALDECLFQIVGHEETIFDWPQIDWRTAHLSLKEQVDLGRFLRAKEHFLANTDRVLDLFVHQAGNIYGSVAAYLPKATEDGPSFTVPLFSVLKSPNALLDHFSGTLTGGAAMEAGLFARLGRRMYENTCAASGVVPYEEHRKPLVSPLASKLPPNELVEAYLRGTPLLELMKTPVTFAIPDASRFEHQWIVAGSGHGKTQTLQYLIAHDLEQVAKGEASVIVIDSQGDLIRNLSRLQFFARHHEKLVLIDPSDIEYPVALNLFDVGMDRIAGYSPLERERVLNGILELYDFVMGSLLSAELTQKQGVIFRYITRLMLHIPNATIQTFRELMEPGGFEKYRPYINELQGTARAFFETEFQSKQFEDTKRQVVRRLWGILENSTFERMFSHPKNKLNLFEAMNSGKVILINTAKDLLKQQGTEIFGRFFIAMLAQATQERATLTKRLPTYVYIDECQDYLDGNVATILEQARKFNVGMILAHQYIGQLAPKLQESFAANTSIKFAGGVSDKDARALAGMLRCSPQFIEEQSKGHFAAFVRNVTEQAISLRVPFGRVEAMDRMADATWLSLRSIMRSRYAVHHSEVELHISALLQAPETIAARVPTIDAKPSAAVPRQLKMKAVTSDSTPNEATPSDTAGRDLGAVPSSRPAPKVEPVAAPAKPATSSTSAPPQKPIDPDNADVSPSSDW